MTSQEQQRRTPAIDGEAARWFAALRGPDGDASREEFERWRSASPAHREAYAEAERLWQLSAGLSATRIGQARQLPRRRASLWTHPFPRPALAAAAILVVAGGALTFWRATDLGMSPAVAANSPLSTRVGEIRRFELSDGSVITLDTDSAVEVRFSKGSRLVRLARGRARFDVSADAAHPFLVEAAGRTLTARGRMFDVGIGPEGMSVTLFQGTADVRGLSFGGNPASFTRLTAGECFTEVRRRPQVAKAQAGASRWVSGLLDFDGIPLTDVLAQTNRYSAFKIRLADPALGALRVTGAFRPLPVDTLAASLATAFELSVVRQPGGDLLLVRRSAPTSGK